MLFVLHFSALCLAFSTKTQSILHQNALRFAAKRTLFCSKQLRNRRKWRCFQINIHFANIHMLPLFGPKQTFARIDFLRQDRRLVDEKGTHNVKILAENQTKQRLAIYKHMRIGIVSTNIYDRQLMWLQSLLPTANNGCIM